MTHALELAYQPVPVGLMGLALDEGVGAQVGVGLARLNRCQAITRIEWATARAAFLGPRRPRSRAYWAAR